MVLRRGYSDHSTGLEASRCQAPWSLLAPPRSQASTTSTVVAPRPPPCPALRRTPHPAHRLCGAISAPRPPHPARTPSPWHVSGPTLTHHSPSKKWGEEKERAGRWEAPSQALQSPPSQQAGAILKHANVQHDQIVAESIAREIVIREGGGGRRNHRHH